MKARIVGLGDSGSGFHQIVARLINGNNKLRPHKIIIEMTEAEFKRLEYQIGSDIEITINNCTARKIHPKNYHGDLIPIHEFIEDCKCFAFTNDDGFGYFATKSEDGTIHEHEPVKISDFLGDTVYTGEYLYVSWYNK